MGCIHIYCGDGKGKTTAAIGMAVRMAGCGGRAVVARFLKNETSGEAAALCRFPEITVLPCTRDFGFTWQMSEQEKYEAAAFYGKMLQKACEAAYFLASGAGESGNLPVLLVLDEACAALNSGLLRLDEVVRLLDGRPKMLEVVLTGRNPPEELLKRADYVTEMKKLHHPFDHGLKARRGIEY